MKFHPYDSGSVSTDTASSVQSAYLTLLYDTNSNYLDFVEYGSGGVQIIVKYFILN